ncbi:MAG: hypothetical protein K8F24_12920, partial [Bacteroidales bacterium]|nr:hypothetical protein [Bacteroidales bacterium]
MNPGTYQECLTIDKSISILGPNEAISPNTGVRVGEAVIDAGFNYRVLAIDHALDFTSTGITFIMKGMTIDMENAADQSRFANNQSGAENNYTFENNRFLNGVPCTNGNWWFTGTGTTLQFNLLDNYFNNGDVSNGISIWVNGVNNVIVQDNVWEDNKAWAMNFNRVVGTIANNKFIDNDAADPDIIWYNNQNGFIIA